MPIQLREPFAQNANAVILGDLNPAILHPEWFRRQGLVDDETCGSAEIRVVSQQVTELMIGGIKLFATDDKIILSVSDPAYTERLQDFSCGLLAKLPHTPLKAAGINSDVHLQLDSEASWHSIGHALAPKDPVWKGICESPGMENLTIQSPVSSWTYPIIENLTVKPYQKDHLKHPAIVIKANIHFSVPIEGESAFHADTAKIVGSFLSECWDLSMGRAREVAEAIFKNIDRTT